MYLLKIRFKDNGDPFFMRTWDIVEEFNSRNNALEFGACIVDNTVDKAVVINIKTKHTEDVFNFLDLKHLLGN